MRKTFYFAVLMIAATIAFTASSYGQGRPVLGGFKTISTSDAGVAAAADFAVAAESEATEMEFVLVDIAKAESQVVAGTNYRLCLEVSANGSDSSFVQTVVSYDLQRNYHLTSWAGSTCGGSSDGSTGSLPPTEVKPYKEISKTDTGAETAAKFGVGEHASKTKTKLEFGAIVKAEAQEGKGMNMRYRLCIKVTGADAKPSFSRALISVDQYSNYKLLSWVDSTCGK